MKSIQEKEAAIKLAVPPTVYERMRQTIDDLLATIRSAYANGLGNEDELRRAERLSIGLSADLGYIEVAPEPPAALRHALRYRYQQTENGRPQGPALLVDYRIAQQEIELLRIIAEKPFADLSGLSDDSIGLLDDSLVDDIIREIRQHEEEVDDSSIEGYLADRRYDQKIDRVLEDILDTVRPPRRVTE